MRNHTKEYKDSMVEAWFRAKEKNPDIVQGEFAEAHGVLLSTLRYWIKRYPGRYGQLKEG